LKKKGGRKKEDQAWESNSRSIRKNEVKLIRGGKKEKAGGRPWKKGCGPLPWAIEFWGGKRGKT